MTMHANPASPSRRLAGAVTATTLAIILSTATAFAVEPGEVLSDPALEARARSLSTELRCLVCQNQSIDDSSAPLAKDLRVLVRERLTAGDSDQQVIAYVVARYGEFVLLRPRFGVHTLILWLAPLALLAGTVFALWRRARRVPRPAATGTGGPAAPPALTTEEKARLDKLVGRDGAL